MLVIFKIIAVLFFKYRYVIIKAVSDTNNMVNVDSSEVESNEPIENIASIKRTLSLFRKFK
jgi:hypothetical protein